jgi:2-C-methyl-D-erythritol 2,4-cyclodiphosphate synthase
MIIPEFGFRSGIGFDVHQLVENRKCIIGGVDIPHEKGLLGHSDADVLAHAITDALLGAAGLGDIGTFFPDTDPQFKGIDSLKIIESVMKVIREKGYEIVNIDAIVMCERPKINPHREEMKVRLAKALNISINKIGLKATTTEKLGFTGRQEGIAAQAVAQLYGKIDL